MALALLGLAPSSYDNAPGNNFSIAKPEDLPAQLRQTLESKQTPTRCEHLSLVLEIPPTVEFAIQESNGDAQENIDPAMGSPGPDTVNDQPAKIVRAYEVIINQPRDSSDMQQAVAKNIVELVSAVDESTWIVREVSRGQHGWAITYMCKDSVAMWNRQHAKAVSRSIIGEYSQKELDPIVTGRPAFDCRGTLTILFSKNSRTINVKYEHTPLHKTVGEMIQHFRPLPPAAPPVPLIPASNKPRKTPRKRKAETNEDGTPVQPKPKRKKKSQAAEAVAEASTDIPAADTDSQAATVPTKADAAVQSGIHAQAVLNVPPAEAERRREAAIRLLSESGVDPATLSTEQFGIFANQSPELQKDSLEMLVKYGAERLRIVHPSDAAASSSNSASPVPRKASAHGDEASSAPAASQQLSQGKGETQKSKAVVLDGETDERWVPAPAGTPLKDISRGSCIACRISRAKCNRSKPTCDVCEEQSLNCQYPLVKKQAPRKKSKAQDIDNDDVEAEDADVEVDAEDDGDAEPQPDPAAETEEEHEPDDIETIDYTSNMPVANMLTPATGPTNQDYFSSNPSNPAYAQSSSNDLSMSHDAHVYPEPPATATLTAQQPTTMSYAQPSLSDTTDYANRNADITAYAQPAVVETEDSTQPSSRSPNASRTSRAGSGMRRNLPSGQPQNSGNDHHDPLHSHAQGWQSTSPTMTSRQPQSRQSTQTPTQASMLSQQPAYDTVQQVAARAAIQQQHLQHRVSPATQVSQPTQTQASPFQAPVQAARAKSQAGHRASNQTPIKNSGPQTTPSHHTVQPNTTVDPSTYRSTQSMGRSTDYAAYNTKYTSANNAARAGTRVSYEPQATPTTAATNSTYPSYANNRSNDSIQNTNIAYTPSNNSRSGQYQSHNTQHYQKTDSQSTSSSNQPPPAALQQNEALQSFNMRTSVSNSNQSSAKYQQQQPQPQPQQMQSYNSYSSQVEQNMPQADQHNWYGFGSNTTSFTPSSNSGGYAARGNPSSNYGGGVSNSNQGYHQQHHHNALNISGDNYTGGEGDMYELLKLQGSGR
nr:C6 finger domain-containing protein [Colletotrichum truncatum]KAF6789635.1 C6 finger domain-containing protein [Colletotrichum truncatum]